MPKQPPRIPALITLVLMTLMLCVSPYLNSAHALESLKTKEATVTISAQDADDCCPSCPPDESKTSDDHCCCTHQVLPSHVLSNVITFSFSVSDTLHPFERKLFPPEIYFDRFIPPDNCRA